MGDMTGIEISDVLGLSGPLKKLVETVSAGIGKVYEPFHIKRMAKAKSKEIELISSTVNNCIALPVKYQDGSISIDATDANALVQRAQNRFLFQEMQKQQHIEAVVAHAYADMKNDDCVAKEPVNPDWIIRFFDSIATIGDEVMQVLWGKILAGEVRQPGSFSLRTLETVKNISCAEAKCFKKIAPLIISSGQARFLPEDEKLLCKYGITFDLLMLLSDCGLITVTGSVNRNYSIEPNSKGNILQTKSRFLMANGKVKKVLSFNVHPLTAAGCELFDILEYQPDNDYFEDVAEYIWHKGAQIFSSMKIFEADQMLSESFDYDESEMLKEYS